MIVVLELLMGCRVLAFKLDKKEQLCLNFHLQHQGRVKKYPILSLSSLLFSSNHDSLENK
jgi:hypothetical protein